MKPSSASAVFALLSLAARSPATASPPAMTGHPPVLIETGEILLPGAKGDASLTYFEGHLYTADAKSGRLFVVDGKTETISGTITGLPGCGGFAGIPDKGVGYVTVGARNCVGVIDLRTNTMRKTIPVGAAPSTILYAPKANRMYVVCDQDRRAMLIDVNRERVVGTVALGGTAAPFACVFPQDNRIYQRLRSSNQLTVIDPLRSTVVKRIRMKQEPGPLSLTVSFGNSAPKGGRLYVSQGNDSAAPDLLMLPTGRYAPLPADTDAAFFDRNLHNICVTTRVGCLDLVSWDDVDEYDRQPITFVAPGPHTFAIDDKKHDVYLTGSDGTISIYLESPRYIGKGGTRAARYALPPRPAIPEGLRSQKFNVTVKLRVNFRGDGTLAIKLVESSGIPALDALCLKAYRHIAFQPAYTDGYLDDDKRIFRIPFHNP